MRRAIWKYFLAIFRGATTSVAKIERPGQVLPAESDRGLFDPSSRARECLQYNTIHVAITIITRSWLKLKIRIFSERKQLEMTDTRDLATLYATAVSFKRKD